MNSEVITGNVFAVSLVKMSAKINSFHTIKKIKIADAAKPGALIGSKILKNAPK
jgi:hypothetical protein